jgi:predicted RNA-binding protein with TRAM domain
MSVYEDEIKPGRKVLVKIQDLAHKGQGVGKIDGLAVFV